MGGEPRGGLRGCFWRGSWYSRFPTQNCSSFDQQQSICHNLCRMFSHYLSRAPRLQVRRRMPRRRQIKPLLPRRRSLRRPRPNRQKRSGVQCRMGSRCSVAWELALVVGWPPAESRPSPCVSVL